MLTKEPIDLSIERRVLSNLIMSTELLARCRTAGDPKLFESGPSRAVASWVWEYFDRRGEAPGKALSDIYRQRAGELQKADAELVYDFLSTMSDEWTPTNNALAVDMAMGYFKQRAVKMLTEDLERAMKSNDTSHAERLIAEFVQPTVRNVHAVNIATDSNAVFRAFNDEDEELFKFPKVLGRVIGPFIREDFVAFAAPPKRGKSWWLMATAITAYLQGKQVLFCSLEMSEPQVIRRFWQYLSGCSRYGEKAPCPQFVEAGPDQWAIEDREFQTTRVDSSPSGIKAVQERLAMYNRGGRLEIRTWPTNSLSVAGLRAELKSMEVYDKFVPDVIVLDAADNMDHGRNNADERHRLNGTWMALRGLASERKGAIITASHTGRQTVGGTRDAGDADLSEDIRKLGHVTKLIVLNQTEEEKERGIYRVSCKTQREGAAVMEQVVCTSCLAIGRPFLEARMLHEVAVSLDDDEYEDERPARRGKRSGR